MEDLNMPMEEEMPAQAGLDEMLDELMDMVPSAEAEIEAIRSKAAEGEASPDEALDEELPPAEEEMPEEGEDEMLF